MFEHLFSPITIKGKTIRNRTAVSAMDTGYSNAEGIATEQMIAYQEKKAKGGYGLLFTEDCGVSQDGITAPNVLGIWSDDQIPSHKKMVDAVHHAGALMFCQLYHDGSSGSQFFLGRPPKTASAICQPMGMQFPWP